MCVSAIKYACWCCRLLARLPTLRSLSLAGSPAEAALALRSASCPPLTTLDLSFARALDDAKLRGVLAPPENSLPGGGVRGGAEPSRLKQLKVLRLPGTDITDVAMRYIVQVSFKLYARSCTITGTFLRSCVADTTTEAT